jgi:hypothetical protein
MVEVREYRLGNCQTMIEPLFGYEVRGIVMRCVQEMWVESCMSLPNSLYHRPKKWYLSDWYQVNKEPTMFRNTIKNSSIRVYFYMSWAVIRFRSTGRRHRGKMRKVPRSTIVSIHFNSARAKNGHKCKL